MSAYSVGEKDGKTYRREVGESFRRFLPVDKPGDSARTKAYNAGFRKGFNNG